MRELSGWEIIQTLLGFPPLDDEAVKSPTQEDLENPPLYTPGGLNLEQYYPDKVKQGDPPEDDAG